MSKRFALRLYKPGIKQPYKAITTATGLKVNETTNEFLFEGMAQEAGAEFFLFDFQLQKDINKGVISVPPQIIELKKAEA